MRQRPHEVVDGDLFELLAEIDELSGAGEIPSMLARLLDLYGLKSFAYLGVGLTNRPGAGPYVAVTYSPEWVQHYRAERFVDVDPAIQVGLRRLLPVDWSEFERKDVKVRRLFGEACEFGLGRHGISFPVHGRLGDRALISVTSDAGDWDWRHLRLHYMRDFQVLALHLHQAILRIEGDATAEPASLSRRERECLRWIAEGKTHWECAKILGLAERTVRCYLETARHKLGATNNTHAVNKAGRVSLFSDLP